MYSNTAVTLIEQSQVCKLIENITLEILGLIY